MTGRLLMAVALLVAAPAHASLALTLCTADRCILASDSRTWDTVRDVAAGDTATKIQIRAPYGVAVTHDPAPLSAWAHLPLVPGESAAALAHRILDAVPHGPRASESTIAVVRVQPFDAVVMHVRFEPDGRLDVLREARPELPVALILGWPFADDAEMAAITRRLTGRGRHDDLAARLATHGRDEAQGLRPEGDPGPGRPSSSRVPAACASTPARAGSSTWAGSCAWAA
ncbi:MAG: hypothetical protein IT180_19035 [Acidobacteria bacterium]|nr:hypothetical protein [Acidobacteriota bacterium]